MIILKLALRTILRRKRRMFSIGALVFIGTMLLVFGQVFARSAEYYSQESVINNFTGDFIIYSESSKEKPSPFAFTTPLPNISDIDRLTAYLDGNKNIAGYVPIAQNYSLLAVDREGKRIEVPLIYYAIDPVAYRKMFDNVLMKEGSFFGTESPLGATRQGVIVSSAQNERFRKFYDLELKSGEQVTFLGLTPGGSVNAVPTTILGIFEPKSFKSIFDYINFVDITTYSALYNFTGVKSESLPDSYKIVLDAQSEDDIFSSAGTTVLETIQLDTLEEQALSGFTMIAVKLYDHAQLETARREIEAAGLDVLTEPWDRASGFFAPIARSLSFIIYAIVAIIFLIVAFIFMNTLIINIIERTHEIGTMRALGSEKSFIRLLFLGETLMVNIFFACLGLAASFILILFFGSRGVPLPDIVSQFLIGGGNLPLLLGPLPFIQALIVVVLVSVLATVYPIRVATKISPLSAMSAK